MNAEYQAVNHSLQLLKECDLPRPVKLQVELQLIQIKTLLIDDNVDLGAEKFQQLLTHMTALRENALADEALDSVIGDIKYLLVGLKGAAGEGGTGRSLTGASLAPQKA